MRYALPAATLTVYPGLGQAQEYTGLHTPRGLVKVRTTKTSKCFHMFYIGRMVLNRGDDKVLVCS